MRGVLQGRDVGGGHLVAKIPLPRRGRAVRAGGQVHKLYGCVFALALYQKARLKNGVNPYHRKCGIRTGQPPVYH